MRYIIGAIALIGTLVSIPLFSAYAVTHEGTSIIENKRILTLHWQEECQIKVSQTEAWLTLPCDEWYQYSFGYSIHWKAKGNLIYEISRK